MNVVLSERQRKIIENEEVEEQKNHRMVRKRIIDKTAEAVDDIIMVLEHHEELPNLKEKIPPEKIQKIADCYFNAFKVETEFSDPERVIDLIDENCVLKRKNASLVQELGDMIHRVEYFKYVADHATNLYEQTQHTRGTMP